MLLGQPCPQAPDGSRNSSTRHGAQQPEKKNTQKALVKQRLRPVQFHLSTQTYVAVNTAIFFSISMTAIPDRSLLLTLLPQLAAFIRQNIPPHRVALNRSIAKRDRYQLQNRWALPFAYRHDRTLLPQFMFSARRMDFESCLVHARSRGRCRFTSRRTMVCRHIAANLCQPC